MLQNPHLEGGAFLWRAGPRGVLLIHGLTATTAEVRLLANDLHRAGYTVSAPLLPGHFSHPSDLNRVRWQDWAMTVERAYEELLSLCEAIVVGGESTGALLSLYLASRHPEIGALLLYAPALSLTLRPLEVVSLYLLAPFIPWIPKPNVDEDMPWQGYKVNPLKGVLQLLALQRAVKPLLPRLSQPLLIVQGRLDPTVSPKVPQILFESVSSPVKEVHWMENSTHCVLLDKEREQVSQITLRFLERIFQDRER